MPLISRAEWRWLAAVTLAVFAVTQVPPTVERLLGPTDRVHVGTYLYQLDFAVYHAAMREGAAGAPWRVHSHNTPEPHEPAFMYALYVALGRLSTALGWSAFQTFALAEHLGRLLLPPALYVFVATFLCGPRSRWIAFGLALLGGGLAMWARVAQALFGLGLDVPLRAAIEYTTFTLFFVAPHLQLGFVALLVCFVLFDGASRGSIAALWLLAGAVLSLGLIMPWGLPVLLTTLCAFCAVSWALNRRVDNGAAKGVAVACVTAVPIVLASWLTLLGDTFWGTTFSLFNAEHRGYPSPRPWELLSDLGPTLPLGLVGAVVLVRNARSKRSPLPRQLLPLLWASSMAVWMYLPIGHQNRYALGLQPCLAVLASVGWNTACGMLAAGLARLRVPRRAVRGMAARLLAYPVFLLTPGTAFVVFILLVASVAGNGPFNVYSLGIDSARAAKWLALHTDPDDVVLASPVVSNNLAGYIPGRVVAGHPGLTPSYDRRVAAIEAIYRGGLPEEEVVRTLRAHRVTLVLFGDEERSIGSWDPGAELNLPVVHRSGSTMVYRFERSQSR